MSEMVSSKAATPRIGAGRHDILVLADAGADMWLVHASFDSPPKIGSQFTFQGIEWQLAWRCAQGFGAQPATGGPAGEPVVGNA